jgi:hypothetical protein
MNIKCTFLFFGLGAFVGCSSSSTVTLDQIQTKRAFAMTKVKAVESLRFFALKEGFIVDSAEEEAGRFFAHRVISGRDPNSGDMLVMNVKFTALDNKHTEVLAHFTHSKATSVQTREEEGMLVDCYLALFRELEGASD